MIEAGIYKITNKANGKVYIGESTDILKRWQIHISDLYSKKHHSYKLQNDFNESNITNFTFEILKRIVGYQFKGVYLTLELLKLEHEYILIYDAVNKGYNIEEDSTEKVMNLKDEAQRKTLKRTKRYSDEEIEEIITESNDRVSRKLKMIEDGIRVPKNYK